MLKCDSKVHFISTLKILIDLLLISPCMTCYVYWVSHESQHMFPGFTRVIVSESVAIDHAKFYICLYQMALAYALLHMHCSMFMSDRYFTIHDVCFSLRHAHIDMTMISLALAIYIITN